MIYTFFIGLGVYLSAFPQKVLLESHVLQIENEPDDIKLNEALLLIDILKTEYVNLLRQNIQLRHGVPEGATEDAEQSTCAPTLAAADAANVTGSGLVTETVPPMFTPPSAAPSPHQAILSRRAASELETNDSFLVAPSPLVIPSPLGPAPPLGNNSSQVASIPLAHPSSLVARLPLVHPLPVVAPLTLGYPLLQNAPPPIEIPLPQLGPSHLLNPSRQLPSLQLPNLPRQLAPSYLPNLSGQLAPLLPDIPSPVVSPSPQATPFPEALPWAGPVLQPYLKPAWQNVSVTVGAAFPSYDFPQPSQPYRQEPETPLQYYRRRLSDYQYFDWLRNQNRRRVGESYQQRSKFGPFSRRAIPQEILKINYKNYDDSVKEIPTNTRMNFRRVNHDSTAKQMPASTTTISTFTNSPEEAASRPAPADEGTVSPASAPRATAAAITDLPPRTYLTRTLASTTMAHIAKQKQRKKVSKLSTNQTAQVRDPVASQVASELMKEMRPLKINKQEKSLRDAQYSEDEEWPYYKTTMKIFLEKSTRYPIPLPENHAFCYTNPYNPLCRTQIK